jgi:hypothetical protein
LSLIAQDDVYFTPKKVEKTTASRVESITADKAGDTAIKRTGTMTSAATHSGSNRDVDEYNRRGLRSYFETVGKDSVGNDIIEFHADENSPVDTIFAGPPLIVDDDIYDYRYSRMMSRWDGFYDPWLYGYSWHSPWWYSRYGWYSLWYDPWYDPWYYGYYGWGYGWGYPYYHGYYGWYDPWYYGYNGWGGRYYSGNIGYAYTDGVTGTRNHGYASYGRNNSGSFNGRSRSYSAGTFGGSRAGTFGSRSTASRSNNGSIRVNTRSGGSGYSSTPSGNFGGSRSSSSSYGGSYSAPARSSSSSGSYSGGGGGSFGGSRSSGGGGGGGRSGGGGFGGRR